MPLAGFGKRMRPHTHTKPKPLLSIAGKPGLMHLFDMLEEFNDAQQKKLGNKRISKISEMIFITGYLKGKIEEFIKNNCKFPIRFIEQKSMNGSAGAVKLVEKFVDEPVLIIFPDAIIDMDLTVIDELKEKESGIIWGMEVEDYKRFGVLVKNKDGYLKKMVEKPDKPISKLANIGVYFTKDFKKLFEGIHYLFDNDIRPKGEFFLPDAFDYMIQKHNAKFICPKVNGWYDFGKPETFLESNKILLEKMGSVKINAKDSIIIPPVYVGEGAKIKNSIIGPFVSIGKNCEVNNCIIKNSVIGEKAVIADLLLEESLVGDETNVVDVFRKINIGDHSMLNLGKK